MANSLHAETLSLVKEERRLTGLIIERLQKNSDQKLFLKIGYASLFEYCTRGLGYSESCAYRRISAVRLAKEIPEIKEKLNEGTLNLTNLSMAQSFFSRTKPSLETKKEVLQKIENSTKRQTEEFLVSLGDEKLRQRESLRPVSETASRLRVELSNETLAKLERIRSLRSHKNPRMDFSELIDDMATYMLKKLDYSSKTGGFGRQNVERESVEPEDRKRDKGERGNGEQAPLKSPVERGGSGQTVGFKTPETNAHGENFLNCKTGGGESKRRNPRHIPASIKKSIWQRDQGRCTYQNPITRKRCSSRHLLQMDHIIPLRLRGETSVNNLRLLCHAHHRLRDEE